VASTSQPKVAASAQPASDLPPEATPVGTRYLRPPLWRSLLAQAEAVASEALFWLWVWRSRGLKEAPVRQGPTATVVICAYSPGRRRNLRPLLRYLLSCDFVRRVIVSNNNPTHLLDAEALSTSPRLTVLNQPRRRGGGLCWLPGAEEVEDYMLALDDDLLVSRRQLGVLFERVVAEPEVPHGLAGKRDNIYRANQETEVSELFSGYAVTRAHLDRYRELMDALQARHAIAPELVEFWADDIVISRTGTGLARIHSAGFVLLDRTANSPEIALYRQPGFRATRLKVLAAIGDLLGSELADQPAPTHNQMR
jgi:hypothetical protein